MAAPAPPRILVTRSRAQSSALAAQLQALGAEPILIPTIEIAPPSSSALLDEALEHLDTFSWLLFTSANAVEAFRSRLHPSPALSARAATRYPEQIDPGADGSSLGGRNPRVPQSSPRAGLEIAPAATALFSVPRGLRIAAIGPATAQALAAIGLTPDLVPPQAVAESLADALLPHLAPGARVLLIRAEQARDLVPDRLRAAGAALTIAPAYRNVIPQDSMPRLRSLFHTPGAWPDAITFTSSSTASNLLALLEEAGLTLPADGDHGRIILRASIGPITSRTLDHLGYPPHLEAPEPTIPSLVQALANRLGLIPSA